MFDLLLQKSRVDSSDLGFLKVVIQKHKRSHRFGIYDFPLFTTRKDTH